MGSLEHEIREGVEVVVVFRDDAVEALAAVWLARDFGEGARHDYEALPSEVAAGVMAQVKSQFDSLPGRRFGDYRVKFCDDFNYTDPVDGSLSTGQGLRVGFSDGSRIVFRLSGTGTEGATLRVYLEAFEADPAKQRVDAQQALGRLILIADELSQLKQRTGRERPTVIT